MISDTRRLFGQACVGMAFASLPLSSPLSAAILEGRAVSAQFEQRTAMLDPVRGVSQFAIVGPGVEFEDFGAVLGQPPLPALVDIDLEDTTILITLVIDQPEAFFQRLTIVKSELGMTPPLVKNVFLDPSTNWSGFTSSYFNTYVNIVPNAITITISELRGLAGQFILLNVTPEPAAAALLWPALGLVAARRRRRASSRKVSPAPLGDPS